MKHFVHKIDASGLFVEDCFWEDNATPEVPGTDAIPAVPGAPEVPAVLDDAGNVITPAIPAVPEIPEVPAVAAIPAYLGDPMPADLVAAHCQGGFYWPKWDGTQWIEGGTAPAPQVPQSITMRQARLALLGAGLLDDVEAAVAQAPRAVQIEYEYSSELHKDWPTLVMLAAALGMTDEQVDQLFITASQL